MARKQDFYTVIEIAHLLDVSEETVRRWIRGRRLEAVQSGKEFLVSPWHLEIFFLTGGEPFYKEPNPLSSCSWGFPKAMLGAMLFDQAYFKLEKQHERIIEDEINHKKAIQRVHASIKKDVKKSLGWTKKILDAKTLHDKYQIIKGKPTTDNSPPHWSLIQRMIFMDIHFYFVAGESLRKALEDRLEKDINDPKLSLLIDKYRPIFKDFKVIRGILEHLPEDKQINNPKHKGDFGNININAKGYHFGGKQFNLNINKIRRLRNELCDYFLRKTLPQVNLYNKKGEAMNKKLKDLINQAEEGINYLLEQKNNQSLTGIEFLPKIKKGLKKFLGNKNLNELRETIDIYKRSNILTSGPTDYDSVWFKETQVKGKAELLGSILDEIDSISWEIIKTTS